MRNNCRRSHALLEELAIPIVFLALGALLVITSLAGGHPMPRGSGVGILALAFGGWSLLQARAALHRR